MIIENALNAIRNTPSISLQALEPTGAEEVWLKIEGVIPMRSYKDRMQNKSSDH